MATVLQAPLATSERPSAAGQSLATAVDGATTLVEHGVHEAMGLAAHLPLSGLQDIAKLANEICDGLTQAQINTRECLRVAAGCADDVESLRSVIAAGGDAVVAELEPYARRVYSAFAEAQEYAQAAANDSRFKAYLKRKQVGRDLDRLRRVKAEALAQFTSEMSVLAVRHNDVTQREYTTELAARDAAHLRAMQDMQAESAARDAALLRAMQDLQAESAAREAALLRAMQDLQAESAAREAALVRAIEGLQTDVRAPQAERAEREA